MNSVENTSEHQLVVPLLAASSLFSFDLLVTFLKLLL